MSDVLAQPAFHQLAVRVQLRWLLQAIRTGLLLATTGATLLIVAGRLAGLDAWLALAGVWIALALIGSLGYAIARRPDELAVARAADALGLAERITSLLYAQAGSSPVAELIAADAHQALRQLDPARYVLTVPARAWRGVLSGLLAMLLVALAPIPRLGSDADRAADAGRVVAARQRVQAIELQPTVTARNATPLGQHTAEELRALRDALARSETGADAARAIDNAQQRLAQLPGGDEYAWRRSLDSMAAALEASQDQTLVPLARAVRARDEQAIQRALADLGGGNLGLQAAANAVAGSQPALAAALRRAATSPDGTAELSDLLAQGAAEAAALDGLERAVADLSQLRATTLPPGARLVAATGTPTAYALVRGTPPANATLVAVSVAGSSPGLGPQSGGTGGGAGYGDSPTQGKPSESDAAAASSTASGPRVAPNAATATPYDAVYAPSHLGGEGGPQIQPGSDPTGAGGAGVDLPNGPLTVGGVRPYDQVYAEYAQAARQSAARQSLPPNVQGLVDRYFGAISPPADTPAP